MLSPDALASAERLLAATPAIEDDAEVAATVGLLYWYRHLILPDGENDQDLERAMRLLVPLHAWHPDAVPPMLRSFIDSQISGVPEHHDVLGNRAAELLAKTLRDGDPAALEEAIELLREAIPMTPEDHPQVCRRLANLGVALRTRAERTGASADLDEAIAVDRDALALFFVTDRERPGQLSNLGLDLRRRFERTKNLADLDAAIELGREAVRTADPGQSNLALWLSNLGSALAIRVEHTGEEHTGEVNALDEAVVAFERAVSLTPQGDPARARYEGNLGRALRTRALRADDPRDLDQSIERLRRSIAACPENDPNLVDRLTSLGSALRQRHAGGGSDADRDEGLTALRRAARLADAPPRQRAAAARKWGIWAAVLQRWEDAADGFSAATALLGDVAPRGLARSDQEHELSALTGLGPDGAAVCLNAGAPRRAVELFEQGRGVLLGQALGARAHVAELAEAHPRHAAAFVALRDSLEGIPDGSGRASVDGRRELSRKLDTELRAIRVLPGFTRFDLPPTFEELAAIAGDAPVVLLNVSPLRSDALLLTADGLDVVPLPEATPDAVREQVVAFVGALWDLEQPSLAQQPPETGEARLAKVLAWLWDAVTGPVLARLGLGGPPAVGAPWPRIWWCPSHLLTVLPLHAAGRVETRFDASPKAVLDRVVCSTTPSLRALVHARRTTVRQGRADERLLVVAMPETPGAADLPGIRAEAEALRELFDDEVTILMGSEATRDAVLARLARFRWAHFACHGTSDPIAASSGGLLLDDHERQPFTVLDVARLALDDQELAFLSACSTARPSARLPDESIHIGAGFLLAGYRSVIATLWHVEDRAAERLTRAVYRRLAVGDAGPAQALHEAVRRERALAAERPSTWAAHVHFGA